MARVDRPGPPAPAARPRPPVVCRPRRGHQPGRAQPSSLPTFQPSDLPARQYRIVGLYFDPFQALTLAERLRKAGLRCIEVPQTHASRGPRDTALYDLIVNRQLVLYDDPEIRDAASYAVAQELGNGQIFLHKAGRGQIDLLVALSNCASEARASVSAGVDVINLGVALAQERSPMRPWRGHDPIRSR